MRRIATASTAALILAVAGTTPRAATSTTAPAAAAPPLHLQDRAFMTYALEQDLAQAAFGKLAAEKATDPAVKRFAAEMIDYHRQSTGRLQAAAKRLKVDPPKELNPVAQRTQATLEGLSGPVFDRAYLASQVIGDYSAMYGARREMAHGFDRELRAEGARQAEEMLDHRRAAERLARQLGPPPATGLSAEDRNFLLYAMHVDLAQRGFAEIAAERAADERVKALARDLVDYHRHSYDRLAQLASAKGVEPLREVSAISRGTADRMRRLDGRALDWAFLNAQAFTSYGAHYRYEREAIHGTDPEVRALAAEETRDSRRQHWRALHIMDDWDWDAA